MLRHNFWSCQVFQEENINTKSEGHFADYNATQTRNLRINTLLFFIELVLVITGFYGGELSRPRCAWDFALISRNCMFDYDDDP